MLKLIVYWFISIYLSLFEKMNLLRLWLSQNSTLDTKNKRQVFFSFFFSLFQIESLAKDFILLSHVQQYSKSGLRRKVDIIG